MLRNSVIITALSAFGSVISFLNQLVIAHYFGASGTLDAYLIAASFPTVTFGLIGAALIYTVVPELARHKSSVQNIRSFAGLLFGWIGLVAIAIGVLGWTLAGTQIAVFGQTLGADTKHVAVWVARIMWLFAALGILNTFLGCALNAHMRFKLAATVVAFPVLGSLLFTVCFSNAIGILTLPVGMLLGQIGAFIPLFICTYRHMHVHLVPGHLYEYLQEYLYTIPLVVAAMACFTIYPLSDAYWAPQIGTGNLSYLGYAQRLVIAVGTLVVSGPTTVLVSHVARVAADKERARALVLRAVKIAILAAAGLSIVLAMFAEPLIRALFQRGSFDAKATHGVATLLPVMLLGMVPMIGGVILFRGLFALRQKSVAAWLGIMWTLIYFPTSALLSKEIGIQGIATAFATSWWVVFLAGIALTRRNGAPSNLIVREV